MTPRIESGEIVYSIMVAATAFRDGLAAIAPWRRRAGGALHVPAPRLCSRFRGVLFAARLRRGAELLSLGLPRAWPLHRHLQLRRLPLWAPRDAFCLEFARLLRR